MSEKFKVGDRVEVVTTVHADISIGIKIGSRGVVTRLFNAGGGVYARFDGITPPAGADNTDGDSWAMYNGQLKLAPAAVEIPASPFYVRHNHGNRYKVEVDGLHVSMTSVDNGRRYPNCCHTRDAHGYITSGTWKVIDRPAEVTANAVTTATAEYQRLLREYDAAGKECDAAQDVLDKAEESRRNIGKQLRDAQRALEQANHDAAGVEFNAVRMGA